jgi:hypothetical protein
VVGVPGRSRRSRPGSPPISSTRASAIGAARRRAVTPKRSRRSRSRSIEVPVKVIAGCRASGSTHGRPGRGRRPRAAAGVHDDLAGLPTPGGGQSPATRWARASSGTASRTRSAPATTSATSGRARRAAGRWRGRGWPRSRRSRRRPGARPAARAAPSTAPTRPAPTTPTRRTRVRPDLGPASTARSGRGQRVARRRALPRGSKPTRMARLRRDRGGRLEGVERLGLLARECATVRAAEVDLGAALVARSVPARGSGGGGPDRAIRRWRACRQAVGSGVRAVAVDYAPHEARLARSPRHSGWLPPAGARSLPPVPDASCDLTAHVAVDSLRARPADDVSETPCGSWESGGEHRRPYDASAERPNRLSARTVRGNRGAVAELTGAEPWGFLAWVLSRGG